MSLLSFTDWDFDNNEGKVNIRAAPSKPDLSPDHACSSYFFLGRHAYMMCFFFLKESLASIPKFRSEFLCFRLQDCYYYFHYVLYTVSLSLL